VPDRASHNPDLLLPKITPMIRSSIVRILIRREFLRLKKNPAALMMIGLLTAIAMVVAVSGPQAQTTDRAVVTGSLDVPIMVVFDEVTPLVHQLALEVPRHLDVRFETRRHMSTGSDSLYAPPDWPVVEIQRSENDRRVSAIVHYPGVSPQIMEPFLDWFSPALARHTGSDLWIEQLMVQLKNEKRSGGLMSLSLGSLLRTEVLGATLMLMVQFFCCCHLLVSLTAQDRERKTLSALALSPARLSEIMLAKGLFHLGLSVGGSVAIAAIIQPSVLASPALWITTLLTCTAMMSVCTCIAALARNQAAAGMLALCYMLSGAILFFLATKFSAFAVLKGFTFESYSFPLLYIAFRHPENLFVASALIPLAALATIWCLAARHCFYRFGWK